ncbi:cytochrome P450 [Ruixingdingia sedimenti]|uniref:Cytochrome P450 n=1 Tax=Ruixingdingia sedimenti TaxID=3073604 RepID=A0ABU1FCQ1_9RHOB|nr:cytochrome P450 [Xinfangfangia sp. LG-4]MDR5654626.1 cytochrome P450 [Xinfangfangia sp. LG-4]
MLDAATGRTPPVLAGIDPYDTATVIDPYPFHAALRDLAPVVLLKDYNVYAVGRHAEIQQILDNWQDFSSASGVGIQDIRRPGKFRIPSRLVEADPPGHTEVRAAVTKILSPRLIRSWRDLFEREAAARVGEMLDRREFDAMEHLIEPYVLKVFSTAVGVDLPRENVIAIGEMRFNQTGPDNVLYRGAMERAEPYLDWYEHSVDRVGVLPGSIAEQIYVAEDRGEIEAGVAKSLVRTLVGGGTDSTIAGLGACFHHLARSPGQMALAVADPMLMRTALDEGIRMESPFQVIYRTPNRDVDFAGFTLEKDRKLGLWLGAGNRDPRKWDNPDMFDLRRNPAGVHVAFGTGMHVCIGQMIARLESECLLTEFARRVKTVEPAGESLPRPMNQMRQLRSIPLRVTPQ